MSRRRPSIPQYAWAGLAVLPIFVWWLGWYPGFASSDTVDQFGQIRQGVYFNHHPAIHTLYLNLLSQGGIRPGLVTLVQLLAFGALLAYAASWLVRAGVPRWMAIAAAWALGLSPAIAPTTLALWKDVPFGLLLLWAWIELLALRVDPARLARVAPLVRLGIALAGVWLFRGNGPLTVVPTVVALWIVGRRAFRGPAIATGTLILAVFLVLGPLYAVLDVEGAAPEPAQVFLPDVAASYSAEPESFLDPDIGLLEDVAPLTVWTGRYDCYDSTPLLFDPAFDHSAVRESPDVYRNLEIRVFFRDFDSVLNHRFCAANFVYSPPQPADAYFHRPPYDIPENEVGLQRDVKAEWASAATDRLWRWAEVDQRLWFTWRPAILVVPALLAAIVFAIDRRGRRFLLPSILFVSHIINVMGTSPAQEFRYAYPLYLVAVLTLTLLWPTFSAQGAKRRPAASRRSSSRATR